ncbi:MAG: UDP-3-O-(3-hydroxymyristoyl)glucosamine N-acyltransferase, partial [Gammaproteobacteria bacterium]
TIAHECLLGDDVRIQSGTVIGSDGFGYAKDGRRWVRIPQNGKVRIGSGVEIGANCTIDRGALKDTVIEDGVIIDNLVHIAHNVVVGEGCAMAGCVAIAGSTVIGRETTLAGGVGVVGHLNIPPKSHFAARTLVTKSPRHAGAYASGTPMMPYVEWRKAAARFSQLDQMARKLNELERLVGTIQSLRDAED